MMNIHPGLKYFRFFHEKRLFAVFNDFAEIPEVLNRKRESRIYILRLLRASNAMIIQRYLLKTANAQKKMRT
jgi:hypothetical protein